MKIYYLPPITEDIAAFSKEELLKALEAMILSVDLERNKKTQAFDLVPKLEVTPKEDNNVLRPATTAKANTPFTSGK